MNRTMRVLNNLQAADGRPMDYLDMTLFVALGRAAGEQDWHSEPVDLPSVTHKNSSASQRGAANCLGNETQQWRIKYSVGGIISKDLCK